MFERGLRYVYVDVYRACHAARDNGSLARPSWKVLYRPLLDVAAVHPLASMQWAVQDNGMGTDHAGLETALQADIAALQAKAGATMDMSFLECRGLEAVRKQMDGAARLTKAEECKLEGNAHFSAQNWRGALVGYIGGVWFLQRGEPPCPRCMASSAEASSLSEVPRALGAGEPSAGKPEPELSAELATQRDALRLVLHLNVAAAALKLSHWSIARTACEFVLMMQGNAAPSKARYRLAKALEGQECYADACEVLEKLLTLDADNADATKLLEAMRKRAPPPKLNYETMGAEEWAKLSREEQQRALEEINRKLDEEMGEEPDWDDAALAAAIGGKK